MEAGKTSETVMKNMFLFVLVGALGLPIIPMPLGSGLGIPLAFAKKEKKEEFTKAEKREAERKQEAAEKERNAAKRELNTLNAKATATESELELAKDRYEKMRRDYKIPADDVPPASLDARKRDAF